MDYNVDTVANRMILVIVGLSGLMAVASVPLYMLLAQNADSFTFAALMGIRNPGAVTVSDAVPFVAGIGMVTAVNVTKMFLMKRAVKNAVERDALSATTYLKGQYFVRLILMVAVLLAAGLLHTNVVNDAGNPQIVNLMGAFFGVLTFPAASYLMRFFLSDALVDNPDLYVRHEEKSATQSAIDELDAIGADKDEAGE
ncbi:MAG: hypothetical protein FWC70_00660 [Defluviitaleaceae bacterium]|nr:hypothetical protein [Defluviitaleaceae bacterium]